MPKIPKVLLIGTGVVVGTVGLLLVGVNLYLQSASVQSRLKQAAREALHAPIEIRGTSYTPWGGICLSGLTIDDGDPTTDNFVVASRLNVHFDLLPLLGKRFVISHVTLTQANIVWRQLPSGRWELPHPATEKATAPKAPDAAPPAPSVASETPATTPETVAPQPLAPSAPPVPTAEIPVPADTTSPQVFTVELKRFTLIDAGAIFIDASGVQIATLSHASADLQIAPDHSIEGTFRAKETSFYKSLHPRDIRGKLSLKNNQFVADNLRAQLAGGDLRGDFTYSFPPGQTPSYSTHLEAAAISLKTLITEAGFNAEQTAGDLQGTLDLKGNTQSASETTGAAQFELIKGRIVPVDFIRQVGKLLQIDELDVLSLEEARAKLSIREEKVIVDEMKLKSKNLIIAATGPIKFDGKLKLDAKLLINEKLRHQLQAFLSNNFVASDVEGYKQLEFKITGRLNRPETDLVKKLIGFNIGGDLGGILQNFIRPAPKKEAPAPGTN